MDSKRIEEIVTTIIRDLLSGDFNKVTVELKDINGQVSGYLMGPRLIRIDIKLGENP